jgi:SAM-dependent methyltransferase
MKLSHKLAKLFDRDLIDSTREHLHRAFHPVSAGRLERELEAGGAWEELRRKYPRGANEVHRFGDTKFWIKRNVERAQDLSLDRGPRRHILDLGCGPGFFLYVARKLGHTGVGLDMDEQPIFRDTLRLLQVDRVVHRIGPRRPLPPNDNKFDLITSYLTCFHRIERLPDGTWRTWSPGDWQFFIEDVQANQLKPGGMLLLEFHPQKNGQLYSAAVRDLFLKNGARLFRSKVFLSQSGNCL